MASGRYTGGGAGVLFMWFATGGWIDRAFACKTLGTGCGLYTTGARSAPIAVCARAALFGCKHCGDGNGR